MSNYFDNQTKWSWQNDGEKVIVTTEHSHPKVHTHTMDITNVPIGEMIDNSGKVMGEAHRAVPHEYKDSKQNQNKNKNNGLENTLEGKENMSSKAHQDFCESLNPANYGKEKGPDGSKNNGNRQTSGNKAEDGGRERGDEGHGNHGRESDFKSGSKSNSNVSRMRADMMKTGFNTNSARGELSKNGHAVNNSGKAVTPAEIQVPMALLEVDTEIQEIRQEATVGQQEAMEVHQVEVTEVRQVEVMEVHRAEDMVAHQAEVMAVFRAEVMEGIKQRKSFI